MNIKFKTPFATITTSYLIKSDGKGNGQMFVEGVASTIDIDQTQEKMAPEAIAKMAARLVGKPLRSEHGHDWDDDLGTIVQADVIEKDGKPALWIKAKLNDWLTKAKDLFNALQSGTQIGMSVAGKILPGGLVKELDEQLGKWIPVYRDIEPDEVSITSHPANLGTFALAVTKSIAVDDLPEGKVEVTVEKGNKCPTCEGELCKHGKCLTPDCINKCADCTGANLDMSKDDSQVCKDDICEHEKCMNPKCFNKCEKCLGLEKAIQKAQEYFNTKNQRQAVGITPEAWAEMGTTLAKVLGEGYKFDSSSETIVKGERKSSQEEVNNMDKTKLVSKQYTGEVLDFIKAWGGRVPENQQTVSKNDEPKEEPKVEVKVETPKEEPKEEDVAKNNGSVGSPNAEAEKAVQQTVKKGSSSDSSSGSSDSSSDSSDSSDSSSSTASLSSLLSSVLTTLSDLKSSSSGSSDSSTDSSSDSSDSSTSKSANAQDATAENSSFEEAAKSLKDALENFTNIMGEVEKKKGGKVNLPSEGVHDVSRDPASSSDGLDEKGNSRGNAKVSPRGGRIGKSDAPANPEFEKSIDKLTELMKAIGDKVDSLPQARKGVAVEKSFVKNEGEEDTAKVTKSQHDFERDLQKDAGVPYKVFHAFRSLGYVPAELSTLVPDGLKAKYPDLIKG